MSRFCKFRWKNFYTVLYYHFMDNTTSSLMGESDKIRLFKNPEVFSNVYIPDRLPGREEQIRIVKSAIEGCHIMNQNMIILGKKGTGKTAVIKHVMKNVLPASNDIIDTTDNKVVFRIGNKKGMAIYANCRIHNTKLRLATELANIVSGRKNRFRGWQDAVGYIKLLNKNFGMDFMVVILDEIDMLKDRDNDIIYAFSRWNEIGGDTIVSLILISNNIFFHETIEPRAKSSFSSPVLVFSPYNDNELKEILRDRCISGLVDGSWDDIILDIISKKVARDDGDARKALQIIKRSAEIAGMMGKNKIDYEAIQKAYDDWDSDTTAKIVSTLPLHEKMVLLAIAEILKNKRDKMATTGEIYEVYRELCYKNGIVYTMSQRTISSYLSELDAIGIINVRVVSEGRYGRTKVARIDKDVDTIVDILKRTVAV